MAAVATCSWIDPPLEASEDRLGSDRHDKSQSTVGLVAKWKVAERSNPPTTPSGICPRVHAATTNIEPMGDTFRPTTVVPCAGIFWIPPAHVGSTGSSSCKGSIQQSAPEPCRWTSILLRRSGTETAAEEAIRRRARARMLAARESSKRCTADRRVANWVTQLRVTMIVR